MPEAVLADGEASAAADARGGILDTSADELWRTMNGAWVRE
jgi:hypothetical protein